MILFLFSCTAEIVTLASRNETQRFMTLDLDKVRILARDSEGNTALHHSVYNKNREIFIKLVQMSSKTLDIANNLGYKVIDFALENDWVLEILLELAKNSVRGNHSFVRKKYILKDKRKLSISEIAHLKGRNL